MPGAGKTHFCGIPSVRCRMGRHMGIRLKVCVVDERSEIAASFHGVPQNDMGPRTDVMDGCGKAEGMQLLIRSMSPQIIAVDELGAESDFYAVEQALNCGSRVLGTIHAGNMKELSEKPYLKRWMERRLFQRFIFLEKRPTGGEKCRFMTSIWSGSHVKSAGKYVDSSGKRWFWISNPNGSEKSSAAAL